MRDNTATRLLLTAAVLLARWGAGAETIDLATVAPWTLTGWDSSNARTGTTTTIKYNTLIILLPSSAATCLPAQ